MNVRHHGGFNAVSSGTHAREAVYAWKHFPRPTRDAVGDDLWHNARYPASVYAKPAWDAGTVKPHADFPDLRLGPDTRLPIVVKPEDFAIIVCGAPANTPTSARA
jgi:hypothetical protein